MALLLLILLRVFVLLVTEGALVNESISYNISLGSKLTTDTNPSWLSPSGLFAFGFYQEGDGFAVGIWLTSEPEITVVWTANRDDPPVSSNSTIELTEDGWLLLYANHDLQIPLVTCLGVWNGRRYRTRVRLEVFVVLIATVLTLMATLSVVAFLASYLSIIQEMGSSLAVTGISQMKKPAVEEG